MRATTGIVTPVCRQGAIRDEGRGRNGGPIWTYGSRFKMYSFILLFSKVLLFVLSRLLSNHTLLLHSCSDVSR